MRKKMWCVQLLFSLEDSFVKDCVPITSFNAAVHPQDGNREKLKSSEQNLTWGFWLEDLNKTNLKLLTNFFIGCFKLTKDGNCTCEWCARNHRTSFSILNIFHTSVVPILIWAVHYDLWRRIPYLFNKAATLIRNKWTSFKILLARQLNVCTTPKSASSAQWKHTNCYLAQTIKLL